MDQARDRDMLKWLRESRTALVVLFLLIVLAVSYVWVGIRHVRQKTEHQRVGMETAS